MMDHRKFEEMCEKAEKIFEKHLMNILEELEKSPKPNKDAIEMILDGIEYLDMQMRRRKRDGGGRYEDDDDRQGGRNRDRGRERDRYQDRDYDRQQGGYGNGQRGWNGNGMGRGGDWM